MVMNDVEKSVKLHGHCAAYRHCTVNVKCAKRFVNKPMRNPSVKCYMTVCVVLSVWVVRKFEEATAERTV